MGSIHPPERHEKMRKLLVLEAELGLTGPWSESWAKAAKAAEKVVPSAYMEGLYDGKKIQSGRMLPDRRES